MHCPNPPATLTRCALTSCNGHHLQARADAGRRVAGAEEHAARVWEGRLAEARRQFESELMAAEEAATVRAAKLQTRQAKRSDGEHALGGAQLELKELTNEVQATRAEMRRQVGDAERSAAERLIECRGRARTRRPSRKRRTSRGKRRT